MDARQSPRTEDIENYLKKHSLLAKLDICRKNIKDIEQLSDKLHKAIKDFTEENPQTKTLYKPALIGAIGFVALVAGLITTIYLFTSNDSLKLSLFKALSLTGTFLFVLVKALNYLNTPIENRSFTSAEYISKIFDLGIVNILKEKEALLLSLKTFKNSLEDVYKDDNECLQLVLHDLESSIENLSMKNSDNNCQQVTKSLKQVNVTHRNVTLIMDETAKAHQLDSIHSFFAQPANEPEIIETKSRQLRSKPS